VQTAIQGITPTIVDQLPPPKASVPFTNGLAPPIVDVPRPNIKYPVLNIPTQEEFDAAVKSNTEKQQQQEKQEKEKERKLSDSPPILSAIKVPQQLQDKSESTTDTLTTKEKPISAEMQVPILGAVPIPTNKEVALAGTTAMAATAAALLGKSAVEFLLKIFKPIANQIWIRSKKLLNKDLTDYEVQVYFAFEHQKKLNKLFKKEQKKQKLEQYKKFHDK